MTHYFRTTVSAKKSFQLHLFSKWQASALGETFVLAIGKMFLALSKMVFELHTYDGFQKPVKMTTVTFLTCLLDDKRNFVSKDNIWNNREYFHTTAEFKQISSFVFNGWQALVFCDI